MKPHHLNPHDLRLCARWTAEAATPGRIAVAVAEDLAITGNRPRRHGRIVLLDPVDRTRYTLLETTP